MWVHIPAAGKFLGMLHGPRLFLIVGLLALLLIGMAAFSKSDRTRGTTPQPSGRRRRRRRARPRAGCSARSTRCFRGSRCTELHAATTATGAQSGLYTQSGKFSYDAAAPDGKAVYGASSVSTGQPIFLQLVKQANFHFAYQFESKAAHSLAGRAGLTASLSAPDGWKRSFPLLGARTFSGDHVTVTGELDFAQVKGLLDKVGALSNVTAGTTR